MGKEHGVGVVLESATWVANRDRGALIGYSPEQLGELNKQAIDILCLARDIFGDLPTVVSANVGPRADAYAPNEQMNAEQAKAYHSEQIGTLAKTDLDMISAYTIAYPAEAKQCGDDDLRRPSRNGCRLCEPITIQPGV